VALGSPDDPPVLFPDEFGIFDILAQMFEEDNNPTSSLFGIVDTSRAHLAGHPAGGAAN
jgi:hypothetical protein